MSGVAELANIRQLSDLDFLEGTVVEGLESAVCRPRVRGRAERNAVGDDVERGYRAAVVRRDQQHVGCGYVDKEACVAIVVFAAPSCVHELRACAAPGQSPAHRRSRSARSCAVIGEPTWRGLPLLAVTG